MVDDALPTVDRVPPHTPHPPDRDDSIGPPHGSRGPHDRYGDRDDAHRPGGRFSHLREAIERHSHDPKMSPIPRPHRPWWGSRRNIDPKRDPEMFELVQRDRELEKATRDLARQYKKADSADREQLKSEIATAVSEHFEIRQRLRALRLGRLREELKRIENGIQRRNEAREAIIHRRMGELTGESHDLDF